MSGKRYERVMAYAAYHATTGASEEVRRAFKRLHKFMMRVEKRCDNCDRAPDEDGKFNGRTWCQCENDE